MAVAGVCTLSSEKIDIKFDTLWAELKTQRDELRVQVHLAGAEIKDEWEEVENKYLFAQLKLDELRKRTGKASEDARETLDVVLDEVSQACSRVKHRLKKP